MQKSGEINGPLTTVTTEASLTQAKWGDPSTRDLKGTKECSPHVEPFFLTDSKPCQSLCFTELCSLPHFYFFFNYEITDKFRNVQEDDIHSHHKIEEVFTFLPYLLQIFSFTKRKKLLHILSWGRCVLFPWIFCTIVLKFYICVTVLHTSFVICFLCFKNISVHTCRSSSFILLSVEFSIGWIDQSLLYPFLYWGVVHLITSALISTASPMLISTVLCWKTKRRHLKFPYHGKQCLLPKSMIRVSFIPLITTPSSKQVDKMIILKIKLDPGQMLLCTSVLK